ncbi:MAG: PHB depolymerase family esterase [Hyphomonas sp.]|nr:PHB depolymerase family esterase [Hyphomonas sp.]
MKFFNAGAPRRATDAARLSAANDLVHRTLARHGLLMSDNRTRAEEPTEPFSLNDLLSGVMGPRNAPAPVPSNLPAGAEFRQETYTCASGSRRFRTYIPAAAEAGATGVVVMLHGCSQTPEDFAAGTGMNGLAEKHAFIVVYPEQSRGVNAQSCWNCVNRH